MSADISVPDWVHAYNARTGGKFLLQWVIAHGQPHARAKCRACGWFTGPSMFGHMICVGCGVSDSIVLIHRTNDQDNGR